MSFQHQSYDKHADIGLQHLQDEERMRISASWFNEDTADYWRHARAYECADILKDTPGGTWLTVGDGRWGLDSIRLKKRGVFSATPTDIAPALLEEAHKQGLIAEYSVENAEKLSFADASFDYVFCKEAFHHFPRPYLALYEMLRVARLGVFLIEPNDACSSVRLSAKGDPYWKIVLRTLLGRNLMNLAGARFVYPAPNYEDPNYVYTISRREAEKVCLGLNLPQLVVKGLNDHYVKGCEFEPADPDRSTIFREIVSTVERQDRLCAEGKADHVMLMLGFMKQPLDAPARQEFLKRGWDVQDLQRNPNIMG
ncbi:MAG: hypothetical protein A2051_10300 [Desulfovibrionales bacterium GWA2_65_9]|nr:MAG: hypothetical protein A2051_10300 [Desulfovibrionales bacterium GWA2_65_9]